VKSNRRYPNARVVTEAKYTAFAVQVADLSLQEAPNFKPLMDGKALAKALNTPPGPWMKDALDVVMAYQLRNPDSATAEAAIAEVEHHLSNDKLEQKQNGGELTSSLVKHFLKLTIRPLFVKAKPDSVTDGGHKNTATVLPKKLTVQSQDDSAMRPWKSEREAYALDLLRWCVMSLGDKLVESVWHLLIPPLLTLVDDWEVKYKQLGVELVGRTLEITPPSLLTKTGLDDVFEGALMPCLTYLPTITPESESVPLLNAVYPTLITLSRVQEHKTQLPSQRQAIPAKNKRVLDSVIRKGILYGYTHCSNYPRITAVLFDQLARLLKELGLESSLKHLKYILPILTETLSHPLGSAQMDSLVAATRALQAVILVCWPRMDEHRGEVLRALTFCWVNTIGSSEIEGESMQVLTKELREAITMLKCALGTAVDWEKERAMIIEADPSLEGLFVHT
jgi:tRNA nucleotidyltransferase (CCA-adding enzyme)